MNQSDVRNLFPHIKKGIAYLNHAATGPLSIRVLDVMREFFYERSEGSIDDYPKFVSVTNETREILAHYLNTGGERIAFTDNTSSGLNLLAQGLSWKEGDEVILNDIEFPANIYPFLNLKKKGVRIKFVISHDGIVSAQDIIENFTPRTRLVSVCMVQFLTGYHIDLEKLGSACRLNNTILCVDAIQGLGALRLDLEKCNVDFISCGTQKWMLGLQGLSFIYVSENLQNKIEPAYVGWLGVNDGWNLLDYNLSLKNSAERFQPGSLNSAGIYTLNASLKLLREFGWEEIEQHVLSNSSYLISELKKIGINPFLSEINEKYLSGIVSFKHPDAYSILEVLQDKKIEIAVREGNIRISPHFYNNRADLDRLIKGIKILI